MKVSYIIDYSVLFGRKSGKDISETPFGFNERKKEGKKERSLTK